MVRCLNLVQDKEMQIIITGQDDYEGLLVLEKERLGQLLGNLFWIDPIANAAKYVS